MEFVLSSLVIVSDEQYESILDDKIALLAKKISGDAQVSKGEEKKLLKLPRLFLVWRHHPLHCQLPQDRRSMTTPIRMTTTTRMTTKTATRRRTTSGTRRRRRSCPEHV
jgi:hypothetical protein